MYTIGTSALAVIAKQNESLAAKLNRKLVAFVGTPAEMSPQQADPIGINAYSVFFAVSPSQTDPLKFSDPITGITLYSAVQGEDKLWHWDTGTAITTADIITLYEHLQMASGYPIVLYTYPRGRYEDRVKVKGLDGLPFYAKDQRALYIFDITAPGTDKWIKVAELNTNTVPTGGQIIWDIDIAVPLGWLLCDGTVVNSAQYQALYDVIGTEFGDGDGTDGSFNLPVRDSTIIKY